MLLLLTERLTGLKKMQLMVKTKTIPLFFVFLMSVEVSNLQVPEKEGITWTPGGTGRGGDNLSRCLIILKLYIDFYQNEKQLCHTDLSLSSIGKQTAKITWKIGLLRIGMSRLRWKIRQKVLKTWQKSAQIELEVLKKVLEI